MYVLSFRDMSQPSRGAVTTATLYGLDPLDQAYVWNPAQTARLNLTDVGQFAQAVRGAHVCFIVHGFNVNRDRGFVGGGAMAQEFRGMGPLSRLPPPNLLNLLVPGVDFFIPVLWPGDWYLPVNYPFVLPTARAVGRNLAQFLTGSSATMRRVSFFSHSFGARVVLETLQNAMKPPAGVGRRHDPPVFDTAVLTAAAASDTVLDSEFYTEGVGALRRIVVVSAPTDEVLTTWFPLGNPVEQALWQNDPGPDVALGRDGPVLTANSPARKKTEWYVVTDAHADQPIDQLHGDYMPAPWTPNAPYPNGWSDKRERIAELTQSVLDGAGAPWPARRVIPEP